MRKTQNPILTCTTTLKKIGTFILLCVNTVCNTSAGTAVFEQRCRVCGFLYLRTLKVHVFSCISMSLTFIMTLRIKIFCEILLFQLLLAGKGDSQRFRLEPSQQTARLPLAQRSSNRRLDTGCTLYDARYHFSELQVE